MSRRPVPAARHTLYVFHYVSQGLDEAQVVLKCDACRWLKSTTAKGVDDLFDMQEQHQDDVANGRWP